MDSAVLDKLTVVKHVGFIGGSCLLFNQMTGPAIPFTGASFQNPGWLFTGVMYAVLTIVAGFAALFLVEAIQSIPGNSHFQGTVEYGTLVNFFFGKRLHLAAQFFVYGALMSSAIASIVITAQTTDNLMIALFSKSCGLSFTRGWICVAGGSTSPSPFGNEFMVFTIGLLVVVVCCLPLGLADFDNNIVFNIITAALSMLLAVAWIVCAFAMGADAERLRMIEPVQTSYALVVGTILLNLACPTVVPSWINVKHKETNVQAMIWTVVIGTSLFCILIGLVTGAGFDTNGTGNVLYALFTYGKPTVLATLSAGVFAFIMLLPGIPVSFIVSFNNLVQNEVVSPSIATFLSFFLPWIILAPLQTGNIIYTMQVWTSLFFCSTANYILPFVIYFKCVEFRREYNTKRILTKNQIKVLLKVHHISPAIISFISPSPFADTTAVDLPQIVVVEGDSGEQVPQPAASAADAARLAQTAANSQHHLSPHATITAPGIVINNSVSISSAPRKSSVTSPSPQRPQLATPQPLVARLSRCIPSRQRRQPRQTVARQQSWPQTRVTMETAVATSAVAHTSLPATTTSLSRLDSHGQHRDGLLNPLDTPAPACHQSTRHHEPRRRSFSSSCSSQHQPVAATRARVCGEPFRVIPRWLAWMALLTTSAVCVCNMIFYLIVSA
ncbi:hypothetical protein BC831DRAFT_479890 [Entophlyctis helioformis]|nr:hypothetical protein BC831DRAFT_479890 [Entophlyctis helioformis]